DLPLQLRRDLEPGALGPVEQFLHRPRPFERVAVIVDQRIEACHGGRLCLDRRRALLYLAHLALETVFARATPAASSPTPAATLAGRRRIIPDGDRSDGRTTTDPPGLRCGRARA